MAAFWKIKTKAPPIASEMKNSTGWANGSVNISMAES
jgi:hypothetical protein